MRVIIGIDPGLKNTGWGIIKFSNNSFSYINSGVIKTKSEQHLSQRLLYIHNELKTVLETHEAKESAIEETFVNNNNLSSLKLSQGRAISLMTLEMFKLNPISYSAKQVKKIVSGYGQADKEQLAKMIKMLMPNCYFESHDAADAVGIAMCHAMTIR